MLNLKGHSTNFSQEHEFTSHGDSSIMYFVPEELCYGNPGNVIMVVSV